MNEIITILINKPNGFDIVVALFLFHHFLQQARNRERDRKTINYYLFVFLMAIKVEPVEINIENPTTS